MSLSSQFCLNGPSDKSWRFLTGFENLRYFAALYRGPTRSPETLLEAVGLDSDRGRRVGVYSKGRKCRLSIARCDPDLLFIDEPTGGLDSLNVRLVKDLTRSEGNAASTVFLATRGSGRPGDRHRARRRVIVAPRDCGVRPLARIV